MHPRFAVLAVTLLLLPGCSALLVEGPPDPAPGVARPANVFCTTSYSAPLMDVASGGLLSWWGGYSAQDSQDISPTDAGDWILLAGVLGLASGIVGWDSVRRCRGFLERPILPDGSRTQSRPAPAHMEDGRHHGDPSPKEDGG